MGMYHRVGKKSAANLVYLRHREEEYQLNDLEPQG